MTERWKWIKKTDLVFSDFIRIRDKLTCQKCWKSYDRLSTSIQCSHFFPRDNQSVRFDEVNCETLCGGCHIYLGNNPVAHREHKLERIGRKAFDLLEYRARKTTHFRVSDYKVLYRHYHDLTKDTRAWIQAGAA